MRVAVVQLPVQRAARTSAFQAALAAIDAAADTDPAPDLVLLPAFRDVVDTLTGDTTLLENVHGQTTAGCGHQARAWGIFVALGMAERGGVEPYLTGVMIDRDGDIRLAQRQVSVDESASKVFGAGSGHETVDILLGRMAILMGDDLFDTAAWDAVLGNGAQVVLGSACWAARPGGGKAGKSPRSRIAEQAKRCGLWCAVADVTAGSAGADLYVPGQSTIFSNTGRIIAAADPGAAATLRAEIPLAEGPVGREGAEDV